MITGKLSDIEKVISGKPLAEITTPVRFKGLSIDSRSIRKGNLFVAIDGENNDGHKYIQQAYDAGAAGFVINVGKESFVPDELKHLTIVVNNTEISLREISLWWFNQFDLKVIAVTGTNGKTTTKEMTADVLSRKFNVFRSPGNYNNLYGIPLALCMVNDSYDICVLELGMSYPGEIEKLTLMVKPDIAIITNIGPAHLQTLGSIENIARAKFELLENSSESTLKIMNLDDPILAKRFKHENAPKRGYGVHNDADIKPDSYSSNSLGRMIFKFESHDIHLGVPGFHNLYNAMAACAVGRAFEIEIEDIKEALENYESTNSRMQVIKSGGITIIDDSYNANPTSMKYALSVLHDLDAKGRRIALLGDMKELGNDEIALHEEIGKVAAKEDPDILITVGKLGKYISSRAIREGFNAAKSKIFTSIEEAGDFLLSKLHDGDVILVKASRAMCFDKIVTRIKTQFAEES